MTMARLQAKFFWDDSWGANPLNPAPGSTSQAVAFTGTPSAAASANGPADFSAVPLPATGTAMTTGPQTDGGALGSSNSASSAEAAALLSINQSHALESLPFTGTSGESEGGQGDGGFATVAGDFSSDWFFFA